MVKHKSLPFHKAVEQLKQAKSLDIDSMTRKGATKVLFAICSLQSVIVDKGYTSYVYSNNERMSHNAITSRDDLPLFEDYKLWIDKTIPYYNDLIQNRDLFEEIGLMYDTHLEGNGDVISGYYDNVSIKYWFIHTYLMLRTRDQLDYEFINTRYYDQVLAFSYTWQKRVFNIHI